MAGFAVMMIRLPVKQSSKQAVANETLKPKVTLLIPKGITALKKEQRTSCDPFGGERLALFVSSMNT